VSSCFIHKNAKFNKFSFTSEDEHLSITRVLEPDKRKNSDYLLELLPQPPKLVRIIRTNTSFDYLTCLGPSPVGCFPNRSLSRIIRTNISALKSSEVVAKMLYQQGFPHPFPILSPITIAIILVVTTTASITSMTLKTMITYLAVPSLDGGWLNNRSRRKGALPIDLDIER
jgi:hypothetical protein